MGKRSLKPRGRYESRRLDRLGESAGHVHERENESTNLGGLTEDGRNQRQYKQP